MQRGNHRSNGGGAVFIADPLGLGRFIQQRIGSRRRTRREAAQWLDVSEGHYSKLLSGKSGRRMSLALFDRIRTLTSMNHWPELQRLIVEPAALDALEAYRNWLRSQLMAAGNPQVVSFDSPFYDMAAYRVGEWDKPSVALAGQIAARYYQDALRRLEQHRVYGPQIKEFVAWAARKGHARLTHREVSRGRTEPAEYLRSARLELALFRVIGPITAAPASGGLEREWEELDQLGVLTSYLENGFNNEKVLLDRPGDLEAAQTVGAAFDAAIAGASQGDGESGTTKRRKRPANKRRDRATP